MKDTSEYFEFHQIQTEVHMLDVSKHFMVGGQLTIPHFTDFFTLSYFKADRSALHY